MITPRIDFHSHILPAMDDGSSSVEQSLQMIARASEQGITHIALTPHFYAESDHPQHFLKKRADRFQKLCEKLPEGSPQLLCGAEVQYFEGLTTMEALADMRLGGTKCILIEMPFSEWSSRMIDDIIDINGRKDFLVILAHIERYIRWQNVNTLSALARAGVLFQSNANFFLHGFMSRKAFNLLENGWIHLLGSDAHNMSSRPPNLDAAYRAITKKCGEEALMRIHDKGIKLLAELAPKKAEISSAGSTV